MFGFLYSTAQDRGQPGVRLFAGAQDGCAVHAKLRGERRSADVGDLEGRRNDEATALHRTARVFRVDA